MYYNKNKSKNIITLLSTQLLGGLMLLAVLGGCGGSNTKPQEEDSSPSTNKAELAAAYEKYINAVGGKGEHTPEGMLEAIKENINNVKKGKESKFPGLEKVKSLKNSLLFLLKRRGPKETGKPNQSLLEGTSGLYGDFCQALESDKDINKSSKNAAENPLLSYLLLEGLRFTTEIKNAGNDNGDKKKNEFDEAVKQFRQKLNDLGDKSFYQIKTYVDSELTNISYDTTKSSDSGVKSVKLAKLAKASRARQIAEELISRATEAYKNYEDAVDKAKK